MVLVALISLLLYWLMAICMNTAGLSVYFDSFLANIYFRMLSNGKFWIAIIGIPLLALLPDITIKYFK